MSRMTIGQALEIAVRHHEAGRLAEASDIYAKILAAEPNHHPTLHMLGVAAHEGGDLARAHELIAKAIALQPDAAEMHGNLGLVLQDMDRLDDAIASFGKALSLDADFAAAHCNLGGALRELGLYDDAIASLNAALALDPGLAEAHGNLGLALAARSRMDEALASHRRAISLAPESEPFWIDFAACVQAMAFTAIDDALFEDLLALLDRPWIDPSAVAPAILSALCLHPDIARLGSSAVSAKDAVALAAIPLLLRLMALSPLKHLALEEMLTSLRRAMLGAVIAGEWDDGAQPFAVTLARHCFVNEYVFAESPEEQALVAELEPGAALPAQVAMLGAYRPLHRFAWAEALSWPGDIGALLTQQVVEPLAERALCGAMLRLTDIGGGVSQAVRDQYEENPYPRWARFGAHGMAAGIAEILRGPPLEFALDGYRSPDAPEILIAGCGTGQQSLLAANRFANARILAVDLSLASLAYAARMTGDLGVSNIEYAQADIMALGEIGRDFDLIECVGVLHHLADPEAGWRILAGLLRPGGVMKIGLYSEAARRDVVAGRALIAERGYQSSSGGIRRCRREIVALARRGVAKMAQISERDSFFTTRECRDLLFHVQEHRFTLPRIEAALGALGLEFLGF